METLRDLHKALALKYGKCLWHEECLNPTIKAHSIQNSQVFDRIQQKGHVIGPKINVSGSVSSVKFEPLGRNNASTFKGLCGFHDNKLFSPIDDATVDISNPEHLFLLAYRSVLKELFVKIENAVIAQTLYSKAVSDNKIRGDIPTPLGIHATMQWATAYETQLYRENFDLAFVKNDYTKIEHMVELFKQQRPSVTASQLFSIDEVMGEEDVPRCVLNILPLTDSTTISVFSFLKIEGSHVRDYLPDFTQTNEAHRKYLISKIVLERCENFFLNPETYHSWSDSKKELIRSYFERTILGTDYGDNPDFYLFD